MEKPYKEQEAAEQSVKEPMVDNRLSEKKEKVSKRDVINQLFGSIRLPEDFDYKKVLEDAIIENLGEPIS